MGEKNNERKKILLVIAIFIVLIAISVGGVYAYFSARATNSGSTITGKTLDINGTTLTIAASRVAMNPEQTPVSDDLVPANFGTSPTEITTTEVNRALTKQCSLGGYTGCHVWKVTATSSIDIPSANIKLNLNLNLPVASGRVCSEKDGTCRDIESVIDENNWSYVVYTGTDSSSTTILNRGLINSDFGDTTTIDIHNGASLSANTPAVYYVMVYLNNTNSVQNDGITTNTTKETGTYNGTVILEAMGGEVYVNFYEPESTDVSFFSYSREVLGATYTITDQSACENSIVNMGATSEQAATLCSGGSINGGITLEYLIVHNGFIPDGLSNVNILKANEVTITGYHDAATFTVSDQSACESYVVNAGLSSTEATTLCSGGTLEDGFKLEYAILEGIPSSDYSAAGLSNVAIIPAPTDVVIPSEIEGHPVTSIGFGAFESKGLTSVVIPNSVTSIGDGAFNYNPLTSIEIGNENANIGNCAFGVNPPLSESFLSNYSCNP